MGMKHRKLLCMSAFSLYLSVISCSTFSSKNTETSQDQEKRLAKLEENVSHLKFHVSELQQDNALSKKLIGAIENDLQAQNEELATQKKNVSILNRGLRSGIFEELPEDRANNSVKKLSSSMLPDFANGRSGFDDSNNVTSMMPIENLETNEDPIGPKELLASAEIKIRKAEFKDGLLKLEELKKKFPNFDDNGRSFLLSAESWLKLK